MDPEKTAETYFCYWRKHKKEGKWSERGRLVSEEIRQLVEIDPDEAWKLICILVNKAPSDDLLAFIAAGPLEDLLHKHGLTVIDRVEEESRKNGRMRLALSGVWGLHPGIPVFDRWHALMQKYGFADGTRPAL